MNETQKLIDDLRASATLSRPTKPHLSSLLTRAADALATTPIHGLPNAVLVDVKEVMVSHGEYPAASYIRDIQALSLAPASTQR